MAHCAVSSTITTVTRPALTIIEDDIHDHNYINLWYSSSPNTGCSGCDGDSNDLAYIRVDTIDLSYEQSSNSLVQGCLVQVDGGANRKNRASNIGAHTILFLQGVDSDGQGGGARDCANCCCQWIPHVCNKPEYWAPL